MGVTIGSLFTGVGGLDLAVHELHPDATTSWFVESDPHTASVFAHHNPTVPNLGDIEQVDWSTVEPVDIMVGGFPCQDISHAGKMAGIKEGTRPQPPTGSTTWSSPSWLKAIGNGVVPQQAVHAYRQLLDRARSKQ